MVVCTDPDRTYKFSYRPYLQMQRGVTEIGVIDPGLSDHSLFTADAEIWSASSSSKDN